MLQLEQIQKTVWEKTGGIIATIFSWTPAGLGLRLEQYLKDQRREAERIIKEKAIHPVDILDAGILGGLTPAQEAEWLKYIELMEKEEEQLKALIASIKELDRLDAIKPIQKRRGIHGAIQYETWDVAKEFERVPEMIIVSKNAMAEFHKEAAMVADLIAYDLVGAFVAAAQAGEDWLSTMLNYLIRIAQQMASMWLWDKMYGRFHQYNRTAKDLGYDTNLGVNPPDFNNAPIINIHDNRTTLDSPVSVMQSGDTIDIYLDSALKQKLSDGTLDDTMRNTYGIGRNVVVR